MLLFRTVLRATLVLLLLLGITWVFGILAVNEESIVFHRTEFFTGMFA